MAKIRRNTIRHGSARGRILAALAVAFVIAIAIGTVIAYNRLCDTWREQCVITDVTAQVRVETGKMVKADTIADAFGLRNGANLATIDFAKKRTETLAKYPTIKSIEITRQMPDKVLLEVTEREPFVRMNTLGRKGDTGRVADSEGVVFPCRRGTEMLPVIREIAGPGTGFGKHLDGRGLAAIQLAGLCADPEFQEFALLEIDISKPDYLLLTLGDYSRVKIAWDGMDKPTASNRPNLIQKLTRLMQARKSGVASGAVRWDATDPDGRIYADTREPIR